MTYATVAQANTYHNARLSAAAWSAIPSAQQLPALQSATDALDAYAAAHGGWKEIWTETTIPEALSRACCEAAVLLSDKALQERVQAQQQGVASTSIGSASETYTGRGANSLTLLSPAILALLRPYLRQAGSGAVIL